MTSPAPDEKTCLDLKPIGEMFHRVDGAMEMVRIVSGYFPAPALNEIRMAFYHVLKAHGGTSDPEGEMMSALQHCKRAYYDTREIEALAELEIIKDFERDCAGHEDVVKIHIADYASKRKTVLEARDAVENAALNHDTRDERYEKYDRPCEILREFCKEITDMRPVILTAIRKQKRKSFLEHAVAVAIVVTAIAAVIGLIINWLRAAPQ